MSLCRKLQRLPRPEGIRLLLIQAFHDAAPGCQQQEWVLVRSEEARRGCPSALPGTSSRTELATLPRTLWQGTNDRSKLSLGNDGVGRAHPSEHSGKAGPGTMASSLVKTVMGLSDVKEEVYGALDEWAAFELEFPLVATRKALERLRQQEQWHRIIQITKWMFSKGIGKTHGTYSLLLKAYCMDGRLEEAGELWDKLLTSLSRSTPKNMFAFMTNAYRKREMPEKVVEVFEQMESLGIQPDKDLLKRAEEAYQQLNMQEKVELLGRKYALDSKTRRKDKRLKARKALKASKREQRITQTEDDGTRGCHTNDDEDSVVEHTTITQEQRVTRTEGGCNTDYQTDDDENNVDVQATTARGKQTRASSRIEQRVIQTEGGCNTGYQTDEDDDNVDGQATTPRGKQKQASSHIEQRVTHTEGGCSTDYQTDDDEDSVDVQVTTARGKKTRASSRLDGASNRPQKFKGDKKSDTALSADDEFVEQVIATMSVPK